LRSVFGKLDPEEEPARYTAFLARLLEKALRLEDDPATRLRLCNEIIQRLAGNPTTAFLQSRRLVAADKPLLLEITPPNYRQGGMARPETTLAESSLFTGSPADPQLVLELGREMRSADSVDLLVSFIKWSGLRLLMPAFEEIAERGGRVRIITTSYMGASDAEAVEWRLHFPQIKTVVSLVTFQKTEKEFSPSTMYQDYPISRELLHWETQGQTSQASETGQNLIHHQERGYTMLFFVRSRKKVDGSTVPFTFLGPAKLVSFQSERPIQMVWQLDHLMPVEIFHENRRGG